MISFWIDYRTTHPKQQPASPAPAAPSIIERASDGFYFFAEQIGNTWFEHHFTLRSDAQAYIDLHGQAHQFIRPVQAHGRKVNNRNH
jgi:hypothetical protein